MRRCLSLLLGLLAVLVLAAACGDDPPDELSGQQRTPTPEVGDLSLPAVDPDGAETPFALTADEGELLVIYFGYTSCPDVCPTTMADLRLARSDLGDDAELVEVAMATVDPERDTPEVLTAYVGSFFDDAGALRTTDDDELRTVTDRFGVSHRVTTTDDGEIEVEHSGWLYVVDDQGLLRVQWPFGTTADDMASDLDLLLSETA